MTKKKRRNLIIAVVFLLLLVIAYFVIDRSNITDSSESESDTEETEADIVVTSMDKNSISNLAFDINGTHLSFSLNDNVWYYDDDNNFPVDQDKVDAMVDSVVALNAFRLVTETIDDLSEYGLDNPYLTVTIKDQNQKETTLLIGSQNNLTQQYYLNIKGTNQVYTISSDISDGFNYELYDLAKVEDFPTIATSTMLGVTINHGDNDIEFIYDQDGDPTGAYGQTTWFMGAPFTSIRPCDSDKVSDMFSNITSLAYSKCVDYSATDDELASYGLDNPQAILTVNYYETETVESESETTKDETQTQSIPHILKLYVGNEKDDSYYYVRTDDITKDGTNSSKIVNLVESSTLEAIIQANAMDFIYRQVGLVDIDTVDSMNIAIGDQTYNITFDRGETATDTSETTSTTNLAANSQKVQDVKINGTSVDADKFTSFYTHLIGLSGESVIADQSTVSTDSPYFSIVYNRNTDTDKTYTVDYTLYNSSYYQGSHNGITELLINKKDVEAVITQFQELLK